MIALINIEINFSFRMGQFSLWPILLMAMGLANMLIVENTQKGIVFTESGNAQLLSGHWKLCYYYNLTEYHNEMDELQQTIDTMQEVCNLFHNDNCVMIIKFFNSEYKKMKTDVDNLYMHKAISKREAPLSSVGRGLHNLFGVVDEETAIRYENKINELVASIDERHTIEANQTTLIRKSLIETQNITNNLKNEIVILYEITKVISNHSNALWKKESLRNQLNTIINIATLITIEHKEITEKIKQKDLETLIEFDVISGDFKHIEQKLGNDQRLPIKIKTRTDIYKTLKISHVRTKISNDILLLELTIPLVESKKYSIFKSTPVPILHDLAMFGIKTDKKNIIASIDRKEYMEISNDDLNKCTRVEKTQFLCQTTVPMIVSDFNVCEADILFGDGNELPQTCSMVKIHNATYVSEINKPGTYVITPNNLIKIRTICSDAHVKIEVVEKQMTLTIEPNCVVRVGRYRLRQNGIYLTNHTQTGNIEISLKNFEFKSMDSVNRIANISEIALIDSSGDFTKLIREAEAIENSEKNVKRIEKIEENHSIHKFTIMGLSITTFIIIAFVIYIVFWKIFPLATSIAKMAK